MKIVILCKRRPQQKDLWERPYGRFFGLAKGLATLGNEVHFVLLNYKVEDEFRTQRDGMTWHSVNVLPNPLRYYRYVKTVISEVSPDWLLGFSDTYFGICADVLGKRSNTRTLIDAYDNYESYLAWCRPLHWLWRRSLKRCTAITAAGPGLLDYMSVGRETKNTAVIEMAADDHFTPGPREQARTALGLPLQKPIIVYSGSLYRNRGLKELFELIDRTNRRYPSAEWVMSGRLETGVQLPQNCHHLGYVDDDKVVEVLRSADVIVCVNKPGGFGDYSYPVKIYEALATGVPVAAFKTESIAYVLRKHPESLVPFGDTAEMTKKIGEILSTSAENEPSASGWSGSSRLLQEHLLDWDKQPG